MIAITGAKGRLGSALVEYGCEPIWGDVTNKKSIRKEINRLGLGYDDTIIHCAAITDVDECETSLYREAIKVNLYGIMNIRDEFDGRVIYISTDYIFDGKNGAYSEDDEPNPINHYGKTKLLGEMEILDYGLPVDIIVRTTMLYGGNKADFVTKVINKLKIGNPFEIPQTLFGTPTYVYHLAEALIWITRLNIPSKHRIINVAGSDCISRYEFAIMVSNVFGYDSRLIIPSRSMPGNAKRPLKCGLKTTLAKKLGIPIYTVVDGLNAMKRGGKMK